MRNVVQLPFQFHKGAIRTGYYLEHAPGVFHFNSIKVRLEHKFAGYKLEAVINFNSIKVRLEPSLSAVKLALNAISIP